MTTPRWLPDHPLKRTPMPSQDVQRAPERRHAIADAQTPELMADGLVEGLKLGNAIWYAVNSGGGR